MMLTKIIADFLENEMYKKALAAREKAEKKEEDETRAALAIAAMRSKSKVLTSV